MRFHHDLIHVHGWGVALQGDEAIWFRPGGEGYEPGPVGTQDLPLPEATGDPPSIAPWPAFHHLLQGGDDPLLSDPSVQTLVRVGRMLGMKDLV